MQSDARKPDGQVDLLEILVLNVGAAAVGRRLVPQRAVAGQIPEQRFGQRDQVFVLDHAGGGQHHRAASVGLAHVADDGVTRHLAHPFGISQHRPAQRLVRKGGRLEMIEDNVVGRIVRLPDLLQHDAALARQLLRIEGRMLQDIRKYIDCQRCVFF